MSFERKVKHFLEYSGWVEDEIEDVAFWRNPGSGVSFLLPDALFHQLKEHYECDGDIERAAEILERSR